MYHVFKNLTRCKPKYFKIISTSDLQLAEARQKRNLLERRHSLETTELLQRRFWTICSLKKGLYYGVGENLENTYLLTKSRMEVIRVPRSQFIKFGRAKMLDRLRDDLNEILPDNTSVFQAYHRSLKWEKYKEEVNNSLF